MGRFKMPRIEDKKKLSRRNQAARATSVYPADTSYTILLLRSVVCTRASRSRKWDMRGGKASTGGFFFFVVGDGTIRGVGMTNNHHAPRHTLRRRCVTKPCRGTVFVHRCTLTRQSGLLNRLMTGQSLAYAM
jgi:hypothetical protein